MTTASSSSSRLKRLVQRFRGRRIGVVGDLMLDRYLWGTASRLSPEAAVPVVDFEGESECLGGAGNVAANLSALGATVSIFGVSGNEEAGRALQARLRADKIDGKGVIADSKRMTTVKTRIIARHQQIVRVDREGREPLQSATEEKILRLLFAVLQKLDMLVLSDYDKGLVTEAFAERVLSAAHQRKVPVFVGSKTPKLYAYRGSRAVTCNLKEASQFIGHALPDRKSIEDGARALLARFGCGAIVITHGSMGMYVLEEGWPRLLHIPATGFDVTYARVGQPGIERGSTGRQVFDVTGAGDTVLSVLSLAVAAGATMADAAVLANTAAGIVVGKLGTATLTPDELAHALEGH